MTRRWTGSWPWTRNAGDIIHDMEQKKAEQNKVSKTIPQLKKAGEDTAPVFQKMSELKGQIAAQEETLRGVEAEYRTLMLSCPTSPTTT